jgi:Mn2+/Fe2+ NRAMP family transporter
VSPLADIRVGGTPQRSFATLGPGLITGATDDDPSGISTYSVAGTAYGYGTLWIALLTCSGACSILVVANVTNIGADLGGMAEATQFITGIRSLI